MSVGHLPRLGKAGRDDDDDVVNGTVVMLQTLHTNEVLPRVEAEMDKINRDGSLPPGVHAAPYYDRGWLVSVTTQVEARPTDHEQSARSIGVDGRECAFKVTAPRQ